MSEDQKNQEKKAVDESKAELAEAQAEAGADIDTKAETNVPAERPENLDEAIEGAEPKLAKAGKRSRKAVEEAEAEEDRKAKAADKDDQPAKKAVVHIPNPKKRHGKNYLAAVEMVDKTKQYDLEEALELAKKTSKVKFDAAVELHVNLGVDPRQADQMVRSTVVLPAGTGKSLRVAVLAPSAKQAAAKTAGADLVGDDDLIAKIEKGQLDFDMLVATPDVMPKLGKLAKTLGPKGLMPNPKSGTVTVDVAKAVKEAKAGRVEFRIDKQAIIHQAIGKVSFKDTDLLANAKTLIDAIMKAKPAAAKGTYVKAASLTTSMGPGIRLNIQQAIAAANTKPSK